ncbi:MAG TPA: DUF2892 domain-containing protein [Cyclobacteriaceae bacterium]|jgi:fatty acid desaturase|nr:DUF2892 domain-containing protein [Cyclobacteriaceae bacterium]
MKKNMANSDRVIRVIIAIIIVKLYFAMVITGALALVLLVIAFVFVITSFIHFCPLYHFLGIRRWESKA